MERAGTPSQPRPLPPIAPGLPRKEQNRLGQQELLTATFHDLELSIRRQMARMLAATDSDPAAELAETEIKLEALLPVLSLCSLDSIEALQHLIQSLLDAGDEVAGGESPLTAALIAARAADNAPAEVLSLIHISEPTRPD